MKHLEISDDDAVRRLLDEAEVAPSNQLESSLLALRSAGKASSAPAPSPELMTFMTTTTATAPLVPLRRHRNVRGALMVAAALAGTGLGVSGVAAANPDFRTAADQAVHNVVGFFVPSAAGKAEAPDDEHGVPAGIPAAPDLAQPDDADRGSDTGTGTGTDSDDPAGPAADPATDAAHPAAPGHSLAPGQQPETPGANRSAKSNPKERDPAPPFNGVLPGAPSLDGTLPDPTSPDRPKDHPGKGAPLEEGSLPSPDPARIPDLPVVPEPQR